MLQDTEQDHTVIYEFTAEAIEYLNRFPMFSEADEYSYLVSEFYYYMKSIYDTVRAGNINSTELGNINRTEFYTIVSKYIEHTDSSPYHWSFTDRRLKSEEEMFGIDDAKTFIKCMKSLWHTFCMKTSRQKNWPEEMPKVPKGLLSIPSNICLE